MNPTIQEMQSKLNAFRASKQGGTSPTPTPTAPVAAPTEATDIERDLAVFRTAKASGVDLMKKNTKTATEKAGKTLNSIFGGGKLGEARGADIVRRQVRDGELDPVAPVDYSQLSPEAITRLKAKGVPTTAEGQREEIARGVTGPSALEIAGDAAGIAANFIPVAKGAGLLQKAALGYSSDIAGNFARGETGGAAFTPGLGTALGVGSGLLKGKKIPTTVDKETKSFNRNLQDAEESIYAKLTPTEKSKVVLKDKKTLFGTKSVPDLQNTPTTKPIIESVANMPDDIKLKPSDTITVKESKLKQGISRLHQATANNLQEPEIKAQTVFSPAKYDDYMKKNVLDPIIAEYGIDSMQFKNAQKGIQLSKEMIKETNAHGVHVGRQEFDTAFKAKNKNAFKQKGTLFGQLDPHVNSVIETGQEIRSKMNDFTQSLLPENHPFRFNLKEESNLLNALREMRKRNAGDIGKNAITRKLDRNPNAKKAVKTLGEIFKVGAGVDIVNGL